MLNKENKSKTKGLSLSYKLILIMLAISLIPLAVSGYLNIRGSENALKEAGFKELNAIKTIKANQIESFFAERQGDINVLSNTPIIKDALKNFDQAFQAQGIDGSRYNIFLDRYGVTIPRNVKILGPLKHEEVLAAIAACRVFVMTSRSEGLPTVLMEAMALGKPVVGSDRFGIPEVIGSKKCGFIYRFGDAADLSAKFQAAWHDGVRCNEEAKKRIRDNYNWSQVIKRLDSIYGELLMFF